jgi:dGTPase
METTDRARRVVGDLFIRYLEAPGEMPDSHVQPNASPQQRARAVTDYIAGMTDRFAIREHERLFGRALFP